MSATTTNNSSSGWATVGRFAKNLFGGIFGSNNQNQPAGFTAQEVQQIIQATSPQQKQYDYKKPLMYIGIGFGVLVLLRIFKLI